MTKNDSMRQHSLRIGAIRRLQCILLSLMACCYASAQVLETPGLLVKVDSLDGHICSFCNQGYDVLFRSDEGFYGPGFENVALKPDGKWRWAGEKGPLTYHLEYALSSDEDPLLPPHLIVKASITNKGDSAYVTPLRERFRMGVNSQMISYPQWDTVWFPTMFRCEKSFAWGYFSTTLGQQLVFATEEPVASYGLNYICEDVKGWIWGHQIYSAALDLLHCGPLPARHPQHLGRIGAGQTLTWHLHLGVVEGLEKVQDMVHRWANVPQITCDAYSIEARERIHVRLLGTDSIRVTAPNGATSSIRVGRKGSVSLPRLRQYGLYQIDAMSRDGKQAQASIYVRPNREWYMKKVRNYLADVDNPRIGDACEEFYGYYPAFKTAAEFPDRERDSMLEARFVRQLPAIIDTLTGIPNENAYPTRVQNYSSLMGILVDLWRSTGKNHYLTIAGRIGDYICTLQTEDGPYRRDGVHYTAVIYPAKSMFDLATAERQAGMSAVADKHETSAMRACQDLLARLDNIQTEGQQTFEDGMIACSSLQMAYAALRFPAGSPQRTAFTEGALKMMAKHQCLEQQVIPDCRMHGCTERFWEALDIYFFPNQVVQSPHGWTGWKLFAVYYLYQLTHDPKWRRDFLDTMGACLQLMDLNGTLRWGFLCDPYVDGLVCVPADNENGYAYVPQVIGEQYMPQISPWLRPVDEYELSSCPNRGGGGDGTVYEIFNVLAECPME